VTAGAPGPTRELPTPAALAAAVLAAAGGDRRAAAALLVAAWGVLDGSGHAKAPGM